ncbi:retrovirus-related pol polyprotein from transposon TNT 1-94 [Tanacetum coccineum]
MAEDGKLKIDSMMVMISVSVRCRSKTLYIRRSFRSLWQKPNLQILFLVEDIRRKTSREYTNYLLSAEDRYKGRGYDRGKTRVEDHIMDYAASLLATYCKEELKRFKLRSSKVRLANDKTLDISGIGDVVLKTSFGTSLTLKDVRYIPGLGLKRRLILVRQLDEEGCHVGFGDQQWKVTKGSLVVARRNKCGSLYMVKVHPEGIDIIIDGIGSAAL